MKFTITHTSTHIQFHFHKYTVATGENGYHRSLNPLAVFTELFGEPQQELLSEDTFTPDIWSWTIVRGALVISIKPSPEVTKFLLVHSA